MKEKIYPILFICFLICFSLICPSISQADVDLPWSTTYDCNEWTQSDGLTNVNCDGLAGAGGWTCDGKEEQITSEANYPGGGGGKGQRHWIGDGHCVNSGSLKAVFAAAPEIWIRWYMRYELGFQWDSFVFNKILYMHTAGGASPIVLWYGFNDLSVFASGGDDQHHMCENCGWTQVMGGATADGQWHCYEVHLKMDTNGSDGICQVWTDEALVINESDVDWGTDAGFYHIGIGSNADWPNNGRCMAVDFDDIAISNKGYIGPISGSTDNTTPSVSIVSPTSGQTISESVTILADASDNIGVVGTQFKLDGANLGPEDTTSPYATSWDTTTTSNGSHTLTATARDAAGNYATSDTVTITIDNIDSYDQILFETWENNNINNWDDDLVVGDTHIDTTPIYAGNYAIKLESSNPGNYAHFFGDHPGVDGDIVTDLTLEEYYYLSPGFQFPEGLKLWIMNCFESWDAGYNLAEGQSKPHTWAPYAMTIWVNSSGELAGQLVRADGLGGIGALWQNYYQNVGSPVSLSPETWNKIKYRLKLNSLGNSDGIFQLWVNDELKCNYSNMNYRGTYPNYGWNHLMMSMHAYPEHPQSQWISRDNILLFSGSNSSQLPSPPPWFTK